MLQVDGKGRRLFQNKRYPGLWRAPHDILDPKDGEAWTRHLLRIVKDPGLFRIGEERLFGHPDDAFCDEVDLIDERVFERYSCPLVGMTADLMKGCKDSVKLQSKEGWKRPFGNRKTSQGLGGEVDSRDLLDSGQDVQMSWFTVREIHGYTPEGLSIGKASKRRQ